ncbi:MAG TPA: TetR/AcrR family transcriptional regulator, partial [Polyangiaceae bacterium]|nr:TetR/AcrR family transcriptional regulator [Polyangiaceae bacterium]
MSELERRQAILAAAKRLLVHYGPSKTTIADIAREAGVGVGTVYLEFPSKDAIFAELASDRHRAVLEAMRRAWHEAGPDEVRAFGAMLEARTEAFLRLADEGAHACDLVFCRTTATKRVSERYLAEEHALLCDFLEGAARRGVFDLDSPARSASLLQRAYVSFTPPYLYEQPRGDLQGLLRGMHTLLLEGLRSRPRSGRGLAGSSARPPPGGVQRAGPQLVEPLERGASLGCPADTP